MENFFQFGQSGQQKQENENATSKNRQPHPTSKVNISGNTVN
jgi:hypothetical protein